MKRKTIYTEQYVDCEYDIEFDDILELIESCDENEKDQIRNLVGVTSDIRIENLYDLQKQELLNAAFNKYSLNELMEKLQIK